MENLCHEFDSRFQDYGHIEPVVTFFLKPFNNEIVCSQAIGLQHVMDIVIEIINSIRTAPFQHRLFKVLLNEVDAILEYLILHSQVR